MNFDFISSSCVYTSRVVRSQGKLCLQDQVTLQPVCRLSSTVLTAFLQFELSLPQLWVLDF